MNYNFKIEHVDPLGQGVDKQYDKIHFIPRTLPGEEGVAKLLNESKGVRFLEVLELTKKSVSRINAKCNHYQHCRGCDYLHIDYTTELDFKKKTLVREFEKTSFKLPLVEVLSSENREMHRNRIQLHYDLKKNELGYIAKGSKKLVSVPNCLLPNAAISSEINKLYKNDSWREKIGPSAPARGHLVIYQKDNGDEVKFAINQPYSVDGFTQVHTELNQSFLKSIETSISTFAPQNILELFGGDGNLTQNLNCPVTVIDFYLHKMRKDHQKFIQLDIFKAGKEDFKKFTDYDFLLLDPPRSGFSGLRDLVEANNFSTIVYVSCNLQTLLRDVSGLVGQYFIHKLQLIDFFPGTKHFETAIILRKSL
ncbi:MAG: class I SAM-dependent RNA methyltransferase [Halobacteriovoraceae bacterium]|nr:class I SAM-dependent RNA methyltransferase [Halobacteriovoraceae bacterium]